MTLQLNFMTLAVGGARIIPISISDLEVVCMNQWTVDVTEQDFEQAVVERSHEVPVVIDFWAPWCGPCRIVGPIIEQLAREYSGRVAFGKLNVDDNQMVAGSFGVQSIPTMMIMKAGKVVDVMVGALPKAQIELKLKQQLGAGGQGSIYG